jgi:transcriptional regulator with XRE-family HTH domain
MVYSTHMLRHLRAQIGENIHRARVRKKLRLRKVASASDIPEDLIDRYELGKNEIRLDELLRIACVLDVRVDALLA